MISKIKIYLFTAISTLLIFPLSVGAQYGCGDYGSSSYNNCPSTTAPSSDSTTDADTDTSTASDPVILANDQELLPETVFARNEPIVFSGTVSPFAEVHLYFQSTPFEAIVNADSEGYWTYTLTKDLGEGQHTLRIAVKNAEETTLGAKSEPKIFILSSNPAVINNIDKTVTANPNTGNFWLYVAGVIFLVLLVAGIAGFIWAMIKKRNQSQTPPFGPSV